MANFITRLLIRTKSWHHNLIFVQNSYITHGTRQIPKMHQFSRVHSVDKETHGHMVVNPSHWLEEYLTAGNSSIHISQYFLGNITSKFIFMIPSLIRANFSKALDCENTRERIQNYLWNKASKKLPLWLRDSYVVIVAKVTNRRGNYCILKSGVQPPVLAQWYNCKFQHANLWWLVNGQTISEHFMTKTDDNRGYYKCYVPFIELYQDCMTTSRIKDDSTEKSGESQIIRNTMSMLYARACLCQVHAHILSSIKRLQWLLRR